MEKERIIQALNATTVPDEQRAAASYLDQCTRVASFCPSLLQIVVDPLLSQNIVQAAAIYLKNIIIRHWIIDEDEASRRPNQFVLSDEDKSLIRENIIDAICNSRESVRVQLCAALQHIGRNDFPHNWPSFQGKINALLHTDDGPSWLGALTVVYRISKVYEYKKASERQPLVEMVTPILTLIYARFLQLANNDSQESVLLQIITLKIIYSLTQFSLNLAVLPVEALDGWLNATREVIVRPIPANVDLSDEDARRNCVYWKVKKWAAKILERVFERYGTPGQVESAYAEFAQHFLQKFSIPCVEAFLSLLDQHRQGEYVSERVNHLGLSFISTAVSHAHAWKAIKPHFQVLVETVIFPFLCHTEDDELLWEENVEEYIRSKYDIFEDMNSPASSAARVLAAACKRKGVIQPVLHFVIGVLSSPSPNPSSIDGALQMVGELATHLISSKKYRKDVEKLLDAHVIGRLTDPSRFVRARAAWTLKTFSCTTFNTPRILRAVVDGVVNRLLDEHEELPVKVESAICMQFLLDDQEDRASDICKLRIGEIVRAVLQLVSQTRIEEICGVMDELLENFLEDIVPIAGDIAEQLSRLFLELIQSDDADERTTTLISVVSTLTNILDVLDDRREIVVRVEAAVIKVIKTVFATANVDFYDEILMLIHSLICVYVSEPMWEIFFDVYQCFRAENNSLLMFSDVMPCLHSYVTTDTESFLARPERLNAILDMCKLVLEGDDQGDDNQLSAAKLLEVVVLQCSGSVDHALPMIIMMSLQRLTQPVEGLEELKCMLITVVISTLYTNLEIAFAVLRQVAPGHPQPLDYVSSELCTLSKRLEGIHNRKMAILAWCVFLRMPAATRPNVISYQPNKVIESCIEIFEGLQKALKLQAETRAKDEESSDEESDDEEEGGQKGRDRHRNISDDLADSEDEINEGTLEYLETLSKTHAGEESEGDDDDDDPFIEETDTESFETPIDKEGALDVFVVFKDTMEAFEKNEPDLFAQMVNTLNHEGAEQLRNLITVCGQHASLENSKKLEQAGGYTFDADAHIPANFNFGSG